MKNKRIKEKIQTLSTNKLLDLSCLIVMELRIRDGKERDNISEALEMLEMYGDL